MRAEGGQVALLGRHLARLGRSAAHFGYPLLDEATRRRVTEAVADRDDTLGVRLTLGPGGEVEVVTWALVEGALQTVAVHPDPLAEAGGALCVNKTTRRGHYQRRAAWAQTHGVDEALLVNERGEVTEGTRTNVWVERDGRLWTPPLSSGGLPGVMREHLLATLPEAGQAVLSSGDLRTADALYLSNALRGWMPVILREAGP